MCYGSGDIDLWQVVMDCQAAFRAPPPPQECFKVWFDVHGKFDKPDRMPAYLYRLLL